MLLVAGGAGPVALGSHWGRTGVALGSHWGTSHTYLLMKVNQPELSARRLVAAKSVFVTARTFIFSIEDRLHFCMNTDLRLTPDVLCSAVHARRMADKFIIFG